MLNFYAPQVLGLIPYLNPLLNEITNFNKGLLGKNKRDLTKDIVKSLMVGDIDLKSNQVLDFLIVIGSI